MYTTGKIEVYFILNVFADLFQGKVPKNIFLSLIFGQCILQVKLKICLSSIFLQNFSWNRCLIIGRLLCSADPKTFLTPEMYNMLM